MTGDSSRREKAQAVLFSLIMVVSMVGIGAAGFAGSAVALEDPKTDDSGNPVSGAAGGLVVADPANPGDDTVHNASVQLSDSSNLIGDGTGNPALQNVTINYSQADVDFDIGDSNTNYSAISLTVDGNSANLKQLDDDGTASVSINNADDTIEVTGLDGDFSGSGLDFADSNGVQISNGSKVFVEIDGTQNNDGETFANAEDADGQSTVTMELGSAKTNAIESQDLTLELPGAVEAYTDQTDDSGSADSTFTIISDALASTAVDGGNKDYVSVGSGEYREFGNAIAVDKDNVTLSGSSAVLNVSGAELDVGSTATASGVTIDGFVFEGNDDGSGAIIDTNGQQNTTITGNEFRNYSAVVVTLAPSDGNEDQITVSSNTFSEGIAQTAIDVNPSSLSDEADTVTVESNIITLESAGANAAIDISAGGGTGQVDIIDGSIEGDSTDNTDTGISTHNENITITGVSINATGTGIDAADAGETLVISDASITNINSQAINLNDPTNTDTDVTINDSTSIDQADVGVEITHTAGQVLTVDITNIEINGSASGAVNITGMSGTDDQNVFNITDNTFTNNNAGIGLEDITNDVNDNINVHFNTFESNTVGVEVNDPLAAPGDDTFNGTLNLQFNDFVDSDSNALNVVALGGTGFVNANYSWWDNRDYSRIVGPYTPQNAESQLLSPQRVYSYTRLHTGGQP